MAGYVTLTLSPCTLKSAQIFVGREHRHHPPPTGHKASISVRDTSGKIRGVAVLGRPVNRTLDQAGYLEVLRVATDGTPNASSMLYGAARRLGQALGYPPHHIITYTLAEEQGTSLRDAGWVADGHVTKGDTWERPGRRRIDRAPTTPKRRWTAAKTPSEKGTA